MTIRLPNTQLDDTPSGRRKQHREIVDALRGLVAGSGAGGSGTVTTTGTPASGNLTKFSGGTSITNGDLSGDVTTSGTLAATIPNGTVTYAKMQDVSATSRILGRITAGAGDVEELTAANVKTILGLAQADISGLTTADSPQFTAINLGHASDTTITRVSAGVIAVEGVNVVTTAGNVTFSNDISVPDEAYGSGWNASVEVPTKNAVYDKIESLASSAMVLISEQSPSGTGTVTFSSISSSYRDLLVVVRGRGSTAAANVNVTLRFNSDSGANYYRQRAGGANATASAAASVGDTSLVVGTIPAASATASKAGASRIEIYDYRGTTFFKEILSQDGRSESNVAGGQAVNIYSGQWNSASAITQVDVILSAGNFDSGSVVSLYGRM